MPAVGLRLLAREAGLRLREVVDEVVGDPADRLVRGADAVVGRDRAAVPRRPGGGEGQAVAEAALERRLVADEAGLVVTGAGQAWPAGLGIDVPAFKGGRPVIRRCLDRTERRHHLAGSVGAALCGRAFEVGWVQRIGSGRALKVAAEGERAFRDLLAIDVRSAVGP